MRLASRKWKGFTLMEVLAVTAIVLVLTGATMLTFARGRPAVRVKRDAGRMVAFLRNMADLSRASGQPLILQPNYETGELAYIDPRFNKLVKAELSQDVRVLGIRVNDRYHDAASLAAGMTEDGTEGSVDEMGAIYVVEGRGLSRISVVFGILEDEEDDQAEYLTMATLNLVTGRGRVDLIDAEDLSGLTRDAEVW